MKVKTDNLQKAARLGWLWTSVEQFGARAISLVVGVILARLLRPEDFGLIASVSIFITVAQQLIDGGIGLRVMQKKEVGESEYCALFFANLAMSAIVSIALIFSAGLIADFFDKQELKMLVMVLGGSLFLSSAVVLPMARLTREMAYRKLAIIKLVAAIIGALAGIGMAFTGYGIWALVGQLVTSSAVSVVLLWRASPWRPKQAPQWSALRDLYYFGIPVMGSQTLRTITDQLVNVLTAKYYTTALLGYLDRGRWLPCTLTVSLGNVLNKVNFPTLAKLQNEPAGLQSTYLLFFSVGVGAASLILGSMAIYAHEIVYVVLGAKWIPSVWFFQMACVLGVIHIIYLINADLLRSMGKTRAFFNVNMICSAMQLVCVAVGFQWGVRGMIIGDLSARFLATLVVVWIVARYSPVKVGDQLKVLIGVSAWAIALLATLFLIHSMVDLFAVRVAVGLILCSAVLWVWWKSEGSKMAKVN